MSSLLFPLPLLGYVDSREQVEDVQVAQSASKKEYRSTWQTVPLYRYKIKVDSVRSDAGSRLDFQRAVNFATRHRGPLDSFLLTDPEDSSVTDMGFAVGDGTTAAFQLQRTMGGAIQDAAGFSYPTQSKPYLNMVKNSSFEDNPGGAVATSWGAYNNSTPLEPAVWAAVPGANGGKAQRVSWGTNNTTTKGVTQNVSLVQGQWYTCSWLARASGTVVGQTMQTAWDNPPSSTVTASNPALSGSWQRYVFQVRWNVGATVSPAFYMTVLNAATGFGDLDFDEVLFVAGQYDATTLPQPNATPAAATATDTPAYWPAIGDGFEPIFDLKDPPTIYQDGDWGFGSGAGKRTLYPYARSNLLPFSEQFDNAAWTKTNATITANTTVAPDGTTTADTFNEGAAVTVEHRLLETPVAPTQGELRCWSGFVKANNLPNITFRIATSDEGLNFNLGTGAIDSFRVAPVASGVITDPRWPGWYRIWLIQRVTAALGNGLILGGTDATYNINYTGTSRTFFAWGAQCERVSNLSGPTPYIKTPSSAAVTVTDYTVSSLGAVTPAAVLPSGAFLSADLTYYRRVRFEDQNLSAERIVGQMYRSGLSLISVVP